MAGPGALEVYEAALSRIAQLPPHPARVVPLAQAGGWVLAAPALAARAVPPGHVALLAGRAVASDQVADATPFLPLPPGPGEDVAAGAALPPATDAVLPPALLQAGQAIGPVSPWQGVWPAASAAAPGALLLQPGTLLTPLRLALLAEAGVATVCARPRAVPAAPAATPGSAGLALPWRALDWLTPAAVPPSRGTALQWAETGGVHDATLLLPPDFFGALATLLALGLPLSRQLSLLAAPAPVRLRVARGISSPPGFASVVLLRAGPDALHPLPWGRLEALGQATHFLVVPSASEGVAQGDLVEAQPLAI